MSYDEVMPHAEESIMQVTLNRSLNAYVSPDTSQSSISRISPGTYDVQEVFEDRSGDATYVEIVPMGDLRVWICTRWSDHVYATVEAPFTGWPQLEGAIDEALLVQRIRQFAGFRYSLTDPHYLDQPIEGSNDYKLVPPRQNNCCVFVEDLVMGAFRAAGVKVPWTKTSHKQAMIAYWDDLFSPVTAYVEAGVAVRLEDPRALPAPWTVCQGWGPTSGHTFMVLDVHRPTRKVCTIESNNAKGMDGPGMRALGDLDSLLDGPPENWWERDGVPTWEELHKTYSKGIEGARLKVTNLRWASCSTLF